MNHLNSNTNRTDLRQQLHVLSNLPRIDSLYWITLLSACSMGETAADLLSHGLKLGYIWSSVLLGVIFLAAIMFEFFVKGHRTLRYWLAILATATVGTTLADLISRTLALGYTKSSLLMFALFALVFGTWRRKKRKGESVEHLAYVSEIHYWAAIVVISILGTTLGDYLSNDTPLGFGWTSVMLIVLLGICFVLLRFTKLPKEPLYWLSIIFTSTFGAASGDYLTKEEGLNLGTFKGTALLAGLLVIVAVVSSLLFRNSAINTRASA